MDQDPRFYAPMPLPDYLAPYTDPAFGTTITRITDVSPSEGENAIIKPAYSTIQAWNADESLLLLWHRGKGHELYDGQTYQFVRTLPLESPADIEQVVWDPWDPDVIYYPSNYDALPRLMRYRVSTNTNALWVDFSDICQPGDWGQLLGMGSDPSGPSQQIYCSRNLGLRCGTTLINVELASKTYTYRTKIGTTLALMIAPMGQVGYIAGYAFDVLVNPLRWLSLSNPYDHGSVGASMTALNAFYSVVFEESSSTGPATLVRTNLDTGAQKVIIGQANGWPYPPGGTHLSAVTKYMGWVAGSAVGDPSAVGTVPLHQEIFLANADTGRVCRLAHHRSLAGEGPWGYWAEPHVVISPSGSRILFGSDWGGGPTVNTYVIDLR
jgi:hypothetical protein